MKQFILLFIAFALSSSDLRAICNLPAPSNFTSPSHTGCQIVITWNAVSGATGYKVRYKKKGASGWNNIAVGNVTSYTVTGLLPTTNYKLNVAALCTNNKPGPYTNNISVKTSKCSSPYDLAVSDISLSSALVSWQINCQASIYVLRYKEVSSPGWIEINNIASTSYSLTSLLPQTNYEVQVRSTCNSDTSGWTSSVDFTTTNSAAPVKANVVLIMLDDARYDAFKPTGGPSFLNYPSIDRIANEGVNFQITLPTTSQCTPSRGTVVTGLYAHKHGALFNGEQIDFSFPQIQQILHDHGYFTGIIGKYYFNNVPPGADWYAVSKLIDYTNPTFYVNGGVNAYPGNVTDVYSQLLTKFFDSIPANKNFFLMFWPIVPHGPTVPRDQDAALYLNNTMPFPNNFYQYAHNFPSNYYGGDHSWDFSSFQTDSMRRIEFQAQQGTEMNVDSILTRLENKGILDSTLVIFTSDNGYLKGEHLMKGKQVALEESIRLPLFMRYPAWFSANSVVNDEIASNMDFAPTILEAANISDTFNMDGISLHKLYDGAAQRKRFYYELCSTESPPPLRAVRSLQYLYVYTFCNHTTEEFYDLVNDPDENTNQIFNPAYSSIIQQYRNEKDSFRIALNDTFSDIRNCNLNNIQMRSSGAWDEEEMDVNSLYEFPNPADDIFQLDFFVGKNENYSMTVKNEIGETIVQEKISGSGWKSFELDCNQWFPGMYFINLETETRVSSTKILIQH